MGSGDSSGRRGGSRTPVVSDASPLIALERIDRLNLLGDVFTQVLVPSAVAREFNADLPAAWAVHRDPTSMMALRGLGRMLGSGEREAIALAAEIGVGQIVIDDGPARRVAAALGLRVIGTAGVVLIAKQLNLVPSVRPVLASLLATGFRLRMDVVERLLDQAGENR